MHTCTCTSARPSMHTRTCTSARPSTHTRACTSAPPPMYTRACTTSHATSARKLRDSYHVFTKSYNSFHVYIAVTFFNFLFTELERSRVRGAFAQYLSPEMVNRLAESNESLVLGGERKEMSFMFADIVGFTPISEKYMQEDDRISMLKQLA